MGSVRPERRVFYRGDNVLEHWVDHAEGFEIRARSGVRLRARVDAVVLDPRRGRAKALVVRSARLHRRRLIPAEAVVAVDPFARRLEIERARPRRLARASRSAMRIVVAVVAVIGGLFAWSGPRVRQLAILAYGSARGIAGRVAASWEWLVPRVRTVGVAAWALGCGLTLRFGGALASRARTVAAWWGPRLSAAIRSARRHTATALAQLGPRLSGLARAASSRAVAVGRVCLLAVVATAVWTAPRLRASAKTVARATLALAVAAAGAVRLVGTRLSHRVRYASPLRRD
jgi:hypothetical protein